MLGSLRQSIDNQMLHLEALFDRPFGAPWNPLRQLGTLSFFFFWVVAVSGLYVYILFDTSVAGAYPSVEYMTNEQWYLGGIMRSLHRYASDAMVLTTVLHLLREFIRDRYRDVRWYAWLTGLPILWFLYTSGISGYWLVWDQLAQYIAIVSMEWLDWLGISGEPVANNFLTPESLTDRFFSLLVFIHIFASLFLLFIMWIHLLRVSLAKFNPPRGLAVGCLLMLLALSLVKPAVSHPPADLATVPTVLDLDWFYMAFYPLYDAWGAAPSWAIVAGLSLLIAILPWVPPLRQPAPARVELSKCNGCTRCFADCPFGAVTMEPRSDGRPFDMEAVVNPALCTACGICVGSCPMSTPFRQTLELDTGIDLPEFSLGRLRALTLTASERLAAAPGDDGARVLVFGCDHGAEVEGLEGSCVAAVRMPCIGMLPPSFIDFVLSREGADGVLLTGCRECDCYHRLGDRWTRERIEGIRDPYLRKRVPRERLRTFWAARTDAAALAAEVEGFRAHLAGLGADEEGRR